MTMQTYDYMQWEGTPVDIKAVMLKDLIVEYKKLTWGERLVKWWERVTRRW